MFILMGKFTIQTLRYQQNFSGIHLCWVEGYLLSENVILKCIWIITGSKQNETVLRDTPGRCEEFIEPYCGNEIVDFQRLTKNADWWSLSEKCVKKSWDLAASPFKTNVASILPQTNQLHFLFLLRLFLPKLWILSCRSCLQRWVPLLREVDSMEGRRQNHMLPYVCRFHCNTLLDT